MSATASSGLIWQLCDSWMYSTAVKKGERERKQEIEELDGRREAERQGDGSK